jgi:hypothetical protein
VKQENEASLFHSILFPAIKDWLLSLWLFPLPWRISRATFFWWIVDNIYTCAPLAHGHQKNVLAAVKIWRSQPDSTQSQLWRLTVFIYSTVAQHNSEAQEKVSKSCSKQSYQN